MVFEHIEKLKREYTDKYVTIGHPTPYLRRFEGRTGIVRTVNMNGKALVEFLQSNDISWYDIDIDNLKIVDKPPEPQAASSVEKPEKTKTPDAKQKKPKTADILAQARAGKKSQAPTDKKPTEKLSTAEKLALLRGEKPSKKKPPPQPEDAAEEQAKPAKKLSTADILAQARKKKKETPPPSDGDPSS